MHKCTKSCWSCLCCLVNAYSALQRCVNLHWVNEHVLNMNELCGFFNGFDLYFAQHFSQLILFIFTLLYRCHLQLQLLTYLSSREIPLPGWLLKYHLFWAVSMTIWQCRLPLSFLPDPQWRLCVLKSLLPDCALKCYLLRGKTKQNTHAKKIKIK